MKGRSSVVGWWRKDEVLQAIRRVHAGEGGGAALRRTQEVEEDPKRCRRKFHSRQDGGGGVTCPDNCAGISSDQFLSRQDLRFFWGEQTLFI